MKLRIALLGTTTLLALVGCGPQPIAQTPPPPAVAPVSPPVVVQPQVVQPPVVSTPPVTTPVAPPTETVKAEAGVTGKGTTYGGGIITESVRQYFRTGERAVFEIQLPYAMKLYKAANDNKGPATHDDYWREIIQANGLEGKLPQLPPGHKYIYDPKTEDLMVERPQTAP